MKTKLLATLDQLENRNLNDFYFSLTIDFKNIVEDFNKEKFDISRIKEILDGYQDFKTYNLSLTNNPEFDLNRYNHYYHNVVLTFYSGGYSIIFHSQYLSNISNICSLNLDGLFLIYEQYKISSKNLYDVLLKNMETPRGWILTSERKPNIGDNVEYSEDGITVEGTLDYTDRRVCMLAGIAGGFGYFGEGFATDANGDTDAGLICDEPKYWRYY